MVCPQCGEPIGWDRRLASAFSRGTWPCPRCAAVLHLRPNRHATVLFLVALGGLFVGFGVAKGGGPLGRWLLALFALMLVSSRALQVCWVRPLVKQAGFGFCQGCGYNLKGLPSERCPECGVPAENCRA